MRILIVRPMPNKPNLNTYNLQEVGLAKALVRKNHVCDIMYFGGKDKDHIETITFDNKLCYRILWLHGIGILREGIYPSLKKYANYYDIIQVGGYINITGFYLNRKYPDKVINYQGPYYCERNKRDILRAKIMDHTLLRLINKDNMIVATKSVLAAEYVKTKGITNVRTIGVGLDLGNIICENNAYKEQMFVKELYEKKEKSKYLLYVGVLEERRNILFIIEVMCKIVEIYPDSKLVIIGKGKEEYVRKCFDLIEKMGIGDNVLFCNQVEQKYMKYVYECCDAFILPTQYEIYGMVLLEAMYFGLPVFTTYNGGSSTMIDETNGFIINGYDREEWAQKIVNIFENSERAMRIGGMAKKKIEEKYTWDALAERFLELYQERMNNSSRKK